MLQVERKAKFLLQEFWVMTFQGSFQRNPVYSGKNGRSNMKSFVKDFVESNIRLHYSTSPAGSDSHCAIIEELSNTVSKRFAHILRNGRLTIGTAQKLLNLHLKYRWCAGWIPEPPHCPVDRIILSAVRMNPLPSWSQIDTIEDYRKCIDVVSQAAENTSIAQWELQQFQRRRYG